jgi:hypothetical protein
VNRPRRVAAACLGVLALVTLSACSSRPGNRRVVSDVIESLQLPPAQEQCMLDKLDGYTDDELNEIADNNENWDPAGAGSTLDEASEGMRAFIADFEQCTSEGGPPPAESAVPSASSEPGATSEPSVTTGPSVTSAG